MFVPGRLLQQSNVGETQIKAKTDGAVAALALEEASAVVGLLIMHARVVLGPSGGGTKAQVAVRQVDGKKGVVVGAIHSFPLELGGAAQQVVEFSEDMPGPHKQGTEYQLTVNVPDGAGFVKVVGAQLFLHEGVEG